MDWIKLWTKFREWGWYSDGITKDLFIELLLTANFEDKEWKGIIIKRGQTITGRKQLSKILGFSEQSIRTSLTKLKSTNEITIKTTNKYTVVTIINFDKYQPSTNKSTNHQPTTNQQLTTPIDNKNIRITTMGGQEGKRYLDKWNQVFGKAYTSTKAIEGNLKKWLDSYSLEEILSAIEGIKRDEYWGDKDLSPEWLLRTKEKGEPVDRIGRMLNNRVKSLIQKI